MANQSEQLLAKWRTWIDEHINNEVGNALFRQEIFNEVREIVTRNPALRKPSYFYELMLESYAAVQLMAVRRLVDTHRDCISMVRLLEEIEKHPEVLTRARFVAPYGKVSESIGWVDPPAGRGSGRPNRDDANRLVDSLFSPADRDFDELAGKGADRFPPERAKEIRDDLIASVERIRTWIDKRLAHYEKKEPSVVPTVNELEEALALMKKSAVMLNLLVRQSGFDFDHQLIDDEWTEIFRVPWIAEGPDESEST